MFETMMSNSLFDQILRLQSELDDAFGIDGPAFAGGIRSTPRGTFPSLNVVQTPDSVDVYVFAPGVDPKKLNISVQQNLLTIAGERSIPVEEKATYYRQERFSGEFQRAISLGGDLDPDRVDATYRDGIVQIHLHRRESSRPRQIPVH